MTRKCHLYIRNADGKDQFKEEFICEVLVKFSESDETRNPPIKNGNAEETNDGGTTDSQTIGKSLALSFHNNTNCVLYR